MGKSLVFTSRSSIHFKVDSLSIRMILRLSSSLSLENDTGLNKEIIHYVSFDMYEKEDVNIENPNNNQTITQTNSENDSSSEFQECLDRAEDLSRRIRALSPKSETNKNTNETSRFDSNQRLSRRQSVMIRRIFEKYSDIIEHKDEEIDMEEAQTIVDNALNACKASDALEALNIGIPKRNMRNSPRLTIGL